MFAFIITSVNSQIKLINANFFYLLTLNNAYIFSMECLAVVGNMIKP